MKTREEVLIDEITENQKRIVELKEEIARRENNIMVARANLREIRKEKVRWDTK